MERLRSRIARQHPFHSVALSRLACDGVCRGATGPGAGNVIPDAVELSGTIRALTTEHFARLHSRVAKVPLCISSVL